ncbi:MAG: hypothetical protein J6K53_10660 [Roseburia sp.]|nr:hypothetical protein [Roseburia sp.]
MNNYYVFKKDNFSACCNLIVWDFIITVAIVATMSSKWFSTPLTGFQQFFIGLLGGFLLIGLMAIRFLRNIIMVAFSVFWACFIYGTLDLFFHISDLSSSWRYGIGIFLFLMALAIHIGSAEDFGILSLASPSRKRDFSDSNFDFNANVQNTSAAMAVQDDLRQCEKLFRTAIALADSVQALTDSNASFPLKEFVKRNTSKLVRQYNHLGRSISRYNKTLTEASLQQLTVILDETSLMLEEYIDTLQTMLDEYNECAFEEQTQAHSQYNRTDYAEQNHHNSGSSNYFKGCDTLEKLNKRYRDLVKIYHSDSGNGNDEVFIEITDEYNRLKETFSK